MVYGKLYLFRSGGFYGFLWCMGSYSGGSYGFKLFLISNDAPYTSDTFYVNVCVCVRARARVFASRYGFI